MPRRKLPLRIQEQVRQRAGYLCEYCHTSELWQYVRFTIDHIVPLAQGGADMLDNLALTCFHCNRRKASHTTAIDPVTDEVVPLFHPLQHHWGEHFVWSTNGVIIIPQTQIGRATVSLLEFNRERVLRIRWADVVIGRHPPLGDPVQG